ncbi:MAG: 50S ribosomal protein L20 [Lentisphaeria bacterium]
MRVTNAPASRKRRKRILKRARGFYGGRSRLIRTAYDAVDRANQMSYTGRKLKKRQFRRLWTIRINAAIHHRAGGRHIMSKKNAKRKRRLRQPALIKKTEMNRIKGSLIG